MAKNGRKKSMGLILSLVVLLLALLGGILFLTLDVIQVYILKEAVSDGTLTGLEAITGETLEFDVLITTTSVEISKFSFMNLLTLIIVAAGLILALLDSKLLNIIGGAALIVGAVFMILAPQFLVFTDDLQSIIDTMGEDWISFKATTGAYVGAVCAGLGGLVGIAKPFLS